jgi:hypothetical protein
MKRKYSSLLFVALLLTPFSTTVRAQNPQSDQDAKRQRRLAVDEALRKPDGVHQAAKLNGGTLHRSQSYSYGFVLFTTLESLAQNSDVAILGTPLSSQNKVIDSGRNIVTEYQIKVQEPIQGKAQSDDVIAVILPGGKATFDDGTTAEVEIGDFPRLEIGRHYVLYLELLKDLNVYQPLGGPEGVFEIQPDGKVSPFATPKYTEAAAKNDDAGEFVEKVRAAAKFHKAQR